MSGMPRLSKSRFQLGLQCARQLWLRCHQPELADPLTEQQQHVFATGTAVGELARKRFAEGVLVDEDHLHSAEALETTARLMADPPPAVFEAAFEHGGVLVRPDALVRVGGEWDLYEVKSSTKLKPEHVSDVAVQLWVLEGAGLRVRRAYLMHLDSSYVYPGGGLDLDALFIAEDVTDDVRLWQPGLRGLVAEMLEMLAKPAPEVPIGKHCDKPYACAFHGHCHGSLPERPVTALPRVSDALLASLVRDGILAIADVPLDYPGLTPAQRAVCTVVRSGQPRFSGDIARSLGGLEYPVHFLDFETVSFAVPAHPGTRPWQHIPFQWSVHRLSAEGSLGYRGFLFEGDGDPRREFVESLLEAVGERGSVVVYASFENTRLSELASAFPEHASGIARLQARLFDLERVVRAHVQHPDCCGRTSLKYVLPALVADLSYDGLGIQDGGTASLRYLAAVSGRLGSAERDRVFADLREYCGLDTLALVRVFEALSEAARGESAVAG